MDIWNFGKISSYLKDNSYTVGAHILVHMTLGNTSVLCTILVGAHCHCIPVTKLQKDKYIFLPLDYGRTSYMSHPQDCRKMSYIIPPNRPSK